MKRGKKLIVANWKMNPGSMEDARTLFLATRRAGETARKLSVVVCAPSVYLSSLARLARKTLALGAQDSFWKNGGLAVGEVSPEMLKDTGVGCVLVGHSERRARGEEDEVVSRKASAVLREGMTAIVCVGEHERDERGDFFAVLREQIKASFARIQRRYLPDVVVAYEPLWAINKNWRESASPEAVREAAIFIRKTLGDLFGEAGAAVPVIYGGSVGPENVAAFLRDGDVAGLLVGHESLDAEAFALLLRLAHDA